MLETLKVNFVVSLSFHRGSQLGLQIEMRFNLNRHLNWSVQYMLIIFAVLVMIS